MGLAVCLWLINKHETYYGVVYVESQMLYSCQGSMKVHVLNHCLQAHNCEDVKTCNVCTVFT